jgi:NAD(P)-dependent dehydrogenase (short-subunit alcohol dehydrogenase family)
MDQAARSSRNQSSGNPSIPELSITVVETASFWGRRYFCSFERSGRACQHPQSKMPYTRTILITGGTSGLGSEAALALARQHPTYQIITASRKGPDSAASSINSKLSQSNILFLPLDLSSRENIRTFIKNYVSKSFPPIAAVLLNAGLQFPNGLVLTKEGFENTFAVKQLGHALLFHLLLENKCLANDARIVITASGTHDPTQKSGFPDAEYTTAERLARPTSTEDREMEKRKRYANSNLCNILWGYAVSSRFDRLSK